MDAQRDTQKTTQSAGKPAGRRTYRRPELVEFGDVRELTRGQGTKNPDGKGSKTAGQK